MIPKNECIPVWGERQCDINQFNRGIMSGHKNQVDGWSEHLYNQVRSMVMMMMNDMFSALRPNFSGDLRFDTTSRLLYSTDASIYQVEPLGVALPRSQDDLQAAMEVCARLGVPMIARGAGSGLAGQAIGAGLVVDCSRYLNNLIEIDSETRTATVEPGLVLAKLNREAGRYGLQFGPDPASAERATLGGSLANNATGAHSITYGMAADHLLAVDVVLADGTLATLEEVSLDEAGRQAQRKDRLGELYRAALEIRQNDAEAIQERWPRSWRRASGYNLNYLLPWSPSRPPNFEPGIYPPVKPGTINLAQLLAGSEGSLALIRRATVRLMPLPKQSLLVVLAYSDIAQACDAIPAILELSPSAVELVPGSLVRLARSVPAYAAQLGFLNELEWQGEGEPDWLVVEFNSLSGDEREMADLKVRSSALEKLAPLLVVEDKNRQRKVWAVRKVGLGILTSQPGDQKPWSFIEDLSVPVEQLGHFVREMDRLLAEHNTQAEIYAHASAGCLHIRPILNLKSVQGIEALRSIAAQAVDLTLSLGGAVSGEHGDGLARTEWSERMFGAQILDAFRRLKNAADPDNLLNPGKVIWPAGQAPPRMDQALRFGLGLPGEWMDAGDGFFGARWSCRCHRAMQRCRSVPESGRGYVPVLSSHPGRDAQHTRPGKPPAGDDLGSPGRRTDQTGCGTGSASGA